ncbi:DDE-type integrase/transposase/recombinase [Amycolatopsis sp. cg5]|uniref:DDE-type integrase/transposase/recombinase n=1 Tax=Amycolatopsis sp. cg5 TaxID=3238802 RepID=UPI0035255F14
MSGTGFSMDPEFVAAVARKAHGEKINVARFCDEHDVSRGTFYHYVERFRAEGADGFTPRSTAPHHHPNALPGTVGEAVLRARKELADQGLDNGALSILWRLEDAGFVPLPSQSSIYRILLDRGQITREPRKRPPRGRRRFEFDAPNACWQIDGLDVCLDDGTKVCIIQILDDHSRLDVGSHAAASENTADTLTALELAFARYGHPARLLSDNGTAFSGKCRGYLAETERALATHGIQTIASTPRHPQTCGKNERVHSTLRRWLSARPTPTTLPELQALLEKYRHIYNNRRHQGIGGHTPQQRYDATTKAQPDTSRRAPAGRVTRPVASNGVLQLHGCHIPIGRAHAHTTATVFWQGDRVTILIGDTIARELTLNRQVRYQRH